MAYDPVPHRAQLAQMIRTLRPHQRIVFLTTSTRWIGEQEGEQSKSTRLAYAMADAIGRDRVQVIEVPRLKIYSCEGNVSTARGNTCGLAKAQLNDPEKNPSGCHRCWASINHPDDELWKISKPLLAAEAVVFFGSIRWGQMNSVYQKLIERLTWLENRHSTLGESNVLAKIQAGIVITGQNWHGKEVLETQRQVLGFYGFSVQEAWCWNWQFSSDALDESVHAYRDAVTAFEKTFFSADGRLLVDHSFFHL